MSDIAEESLGILDGTLAIERVITQEDARLYRAKAILAYLDDSSLDFSKATITTEGNLVPIESEDGKLLGYASVDLVNNRLLAEVAIDYATPERLSAEMREGLRYYPRIRGSIQVLDGVFVDITPIKAQVQYLEILKLVLSTERPSDPRLQALGEPVL